MSTNRYIGLLIYLKAYPTIVYTMVKDQQKNFRLTTADARRVDEVKKRYGVADADIFAAGLSAYDMSHRASDEALEAVKRANRRLQAQDLATRNKRMADYVARATGDKDTWIKLRCQSCGFKFESALQTTSLTQTLCPRCGYIVKISPSTITTKQLK